MAVKLSSQRVIMPCLKSLQVAMQALCLDYDESDFKKQIASALKRSVNFYIEQLCFLKDSFLMAFTFLDLRFSKTSKNLMKKKLQTQCKILKSII